MEVPEGSLVEMHFFPFFGGGHQIPMIDMARLFALHGAKATIITTYSNSLRFRNSIFRDQKSGLPITIYALRLLNDAESPGGDMSSPPSTDTWVLQEPFRLFLMEKRPDCIVVDMFHRWAAGVIDELGIKRIVFNGNGCFSSCVGENIKRYKPEEEVGSDSETFAVPGLPDRIELSKSKLPLFARQRSKFHEKMANKSDEDKSFGVLVNSFYELERNYADYMKKETGKKSWLVGPVSLCNRNSSDKVERGQTASADEQSCLNWLDSKEPSSVLYISFGSLARLLPKQLLEVAHGLEASNHPFIWVVGRVFDESGDKDLECYLPRGFEERMKERERGLVLRGWAPQLLILDHVSVGGFMTHCGWNSTLEGICAGLPMITWPLSAEQFYNEKLVSEVLRIGVEVGSKEWVSWKDERKEVIGREKVEMAVRRLIGGDHEAMELRRRAKALQEKAHRAVEEGGSSYAAAVALISELKSLH